MSINIDKKQVERQFDRAAHTYDLHAQMQHDIATRLAESLPDITGNDICAADLGCGTGVGVKLLHHRYPDADLSGIDIANEMLEIAQLSHPYARFLHQDIEGLLLLPSSVDLLFSSSAIQWCDASRVFAESFRVLKPGGYLLFSTFLSGTLSGWRELWMTEQQMQHHDFLTKSALLKMLEGAGFDVQKHEQQLVTQNFSGFKQAIDSIRELGAGNAVKSRQAGLMGKQKYLGVKTKLEHQLSACGSIGMDYQVGYFLARKTKSL